MEALVVMSLLWGLLFWGPICACIGSRKGSGWTGFFLGVILGIFGLLIIIPMRGDRIDCPYCAQTIRNKAIVCPYCHKMMVGER